MNGRVNGMCMYAMKRNTLADKHVKSFASFIIANVLRPIDVFVQRSHFIQCKSTHIINIYLFVGHTEEASQQGLQIEC